MDVVERARVYATAAHSAVGQKRKYTGDPYIVHPAEVVGIVKTVEHDDAMLAAAWLHDVVEDTGVTLYQIEAEFGKDVADLVGWLTDVSQPEDGNRRQRKAIDRAHSAAAPGRAQTIKLADLISNSRDITQNDKNFAVVYMREKRELLRVMDKGDTHLWHRAQGMYSEYRAEQEERA